MNCNSHSHLLLITVNKLKTEGTSKNQNLVFMVNERNIITDKQQPPGSLYIPSAVSGADWTGVVFCRDDVPWSTNMD